MMKLAASEFVDAFAADGFGVIKSAIDSETALALGHRVDALLGPVPSPPPLQHLLPRIVERDERFLALASTPVLLDILASVLGAPPLLICSYGHRKTAGTAAHTGTHSDVAHLPGVPHHLSTLMVKAMYALSPVGPSDGPTEIRPGTHRLSPDQTVDHPAHPAHRVLLEPGDLLLFNANLRHTATANSGRRDRLSMWCTYALPWMRIFDDYEFTESYLDGIRDRLKTEPNLVGLHGLDDPYATRR